MAFQVHAPHEDFLGTELAGRKAQLLKLGEYQLVDPVVRLDLWERGRKRLGSEHAHNVRLPHEGHAHRCLSEAQGADPSAGLHGRHGGIGSRESGHTGHVPLAAVGIHRSDTHLLGIAFGEDPLLRRHHHGNRSVQLFIAPRGSLGYPGGEHIVLPRRGLDLPPPVCALVLAAFSRTRLLTGSTQLTRRPRCIFVRAS